MQLENIMNVGNDLLKTWFCFYCWAGFWKGHKVGIRNGDAELQIQCLSAFAPLFPVTGKSNYARSTVHFLAILAKHPRIYTSMKYGASVNLSQNNSCFAIDETLERAGVNTTKQSITGNLNNEENLKRQIKAVQSERERMNLLFDEYLDDIVLSTSKRAVNGRRERLWILINKLLEAFEMENGANHPLFNGPNQLTSIGYMKLFGCYESGEKRLNVIFKQEVLGLEPINTKNRRSRDVVVTKVKDIKGKSKVLNVQDRSASHTIPQAESSMISTQEQGTSNILEVPPSSEELNTLESNFADEITSSKRTRAAPHHPSNEERSILETLSSYDTTPPDDAVHRVLDSLLVHWDGWTKKRVRNSWNYQNRKKRKNQT